MKTAIATISLKVKFEFEQNHYGRESRLRDIAEEAMDLAVNPNMHTIQNGVHLLDYETCLDDYELFYE